MSIYSQYFEALSCLVRAFQDVAAAGSEWRDEAARQGDALHMGSDWLLVVSLDCFLCLDYY